MLVSLAMVFFKQGQGDVILYENEILAGLNGGFAYVMPTLIFLDNPVAVVG